MKDTKNVTTYLQKHGPALAGRIAERFRPLVTTPQLDVRRKLSKLRRAPFPAQAGVIEGLVALFKSGRRHGFIVAECGTGKTIMSMAVPHVLAGGRPYRALVMCPGHLVEKWKRELEETVPDAAVTVIEDWKAVLEIARTEIGTKPDRPSYYVISRDRAKLSYFRRPATVTRRGRHACPTCFAPVAVANAATGYHTQCQPPECCKTTFRITLRDQEGCSCRKGGASGQPAAAAGHSRGTPLLVWTRLEHGDGASSQAVSSLVSPLGSRKSHG